MNHLLWLRQIQLVGHSDKPFFTQGGYTFSMQM
jgi:hypothetical protein